MAGRDDSAGLSGIYTKNVFFKITEYLTQRSQRRKGRREKHEKLCALCVYNTPPVSVTTTYPSFCAETFAQALPPPAFRLKTHRSAGIPSNKREQSDLLLNPYLTQRPQRKTVSPAALCSLRPLQWQHATHQHQTLAIQCSTVMRRVCVSSSRLGMLISSEPLWLFAVMLSASAVSGRLKRR